MLADDLLDTAEGQSAFEWFVDAMDATHAFIHTCGARASAGKSYHAANKAAERKALPKLHWPGLH
eukprot:1477348-Alexandrium_andersonii.AAC.1